MNLSSEAISRIFMGKYRDNQGSVSPFYVDAVDATMACMRHRLVL